MRRVVILPAVVLAAGVLAACGSSSSSKGSGGSTAKSSTTTAAATTGGGATVDLTAADFSFTPTSISVRSGGAVKLTNSGSVTHSFTVDGKNISTDAAAGASATVNVDLPSGTYSFHCKYHPTQMKGTLTVG